VTTVIFAVGGDVKVLAQDELKTSIKNKAKALLNNYN